MAARHVSTTTGVEGLAGEARFPDSAWEGDPTVSIPKWLMVLAARGEVTLRVAVDLEDDPIGDLNGTASDDTASGD